MKRPDDSFDLLSHQDYPYSLEAEGAFRGLDTPTAWSVEPIGHTEYQLRNFVLNRREYPTDDDRYRQIVRELWGRKGAYYQSFDGYREQIISISELEARRDRLKAFRLLWKLVPAGTGTYQAKLSKLELKLSQARRMREDYSLDLRERVIREIGVLVDELNKVKPELGDRMKIEQNNWKEKIARNPGMAVKLPISYDDVLIDGAVAAVKKVLGGK